LSRPGCALENITITGGKFLTIGGTFALGNKDTSLGLCGPGPYQRQIFWASRINVILYDIDERRAWLVDGANALLHMTRAALSQEEFLGNPLLDYNNFSYADPNIGKDGALRALEEIGIKNPILIHETPTFMQSSSAEVKWGVKDLVMALWHILEQIQDYQTAQSGPGMPLRGTDRDKLEGYGFVDIVSGERNIRPRLAILKPSGRGWVDFARQVQAITLMSRGLGELIKPSPKSPPLCRAWEHVPTGQDYLVARICQLHQICEKFGNIHERSLELVQNLYWHQGAKLFQPCNPRNCSSVCDRIQTLLPELTLGAKRCPRPFNEEEGAVIFGRSNRWLRWWPRNPKIPPLGNEAACIAEDEHHQAAESSAATFPDSAIGSETSLTPDHGLGANGWHALAHGMVPQKRNDEEDTRMKGKAVVKPASQFIGHSGSAPSGVYPQTIDDFEYGQQFHTNLKMTDSHGGQRNDSSLPVRIVSTQASKVRTDPFQGESSSKTIRKRRGMLRLR
jgi:hypothetical protein